MILAAAPDVVIVATGAKPYLPEFPHEGPLQIVDAWAVLRGEETVGHSVVVIDWRADWIGIGIAEHLAQGGRTVRLAVNGIAAGETLPLYVRDQAAASLHKWSSTRSTRWSYAWVTRRWTNSRTSCRRRASKLT